MLRNASILLLTLTGGSAAYADVLDHHHSTATQLFHQVFAGHHLPITLLIVVIGVVAFRIRARAGK